MCIMLYSTVAFITLLGPHVAVSFNQGQYHTKGSDGKVPVTIVAYRYNFYKSFSVKIKSSVNIRLSSYGTAK